MINIYLILYKINLKPNQNKTNIKKIYITFPHFKQIFFYYFYKFLKTSSLGLNQIKKQSYINISNTYIMTLFL